jgi:threonine/homoserine/homoserine lactone efflux protein
MVTGRSFELFVIAALPLVFFPGPSVAFIVTSSLRHGTSFGVRATAGVEAGYLVHVAAAAVGVSAVLAASSFAFSIVKIGGALYLLWLALSAWRASRSAGGETMMKDERRADLGSTAKPFRQGFVVGASNPKTAVFFVAFLPQFTDPAQGQVTLQLIVLGLTFILLACIPDFTWALGAGKLRARLGRLRRKIIDRVSAAVYGGLAVLVLSVNRSAG